jgi:monofunctional glycosyltransferase
MSPWRSHAVRTALLLLVCLLGLQAALACRVALLRFVNPSSTAFQRSEATRLLREADQPAWAHQWVGTQHLPDTLKRAVIASEDAGFIDHNGVEWEAIEQAWTRNQKAQARAEAAAKRGKAAGHPKLVGGSTISQQLAKNLLLSGERTALRKAQELVITFWLETFLSKERILEIYLNHVEWGEGLFGAQAAAQHYFRKDAQRLTTLEAARLAVMLPAPKRFEKNSQSAYVQQRAATVAARMASVELP